MHKYNHPDMGNSVAETIHAGQGSGALNYVARSGRVPEGGNAFSPGVFVSPRETVAAGMVRGVSSVQFMTRIDAANQALGNRAFMHWVEELHREGRDAAAQDTAPPLQLMPKRRKKPGLAEVLARPGVKADTGGDAGVDPAEGAEPEPLPKQEPGAAGSATGGEKKKKKSRVQVALNTLRSKGVAAFGGYIEAEIGEAALLHTLVERITRAGDLGSVRAEALAMVKARQCLLDPGGGAGAVGADMPVWEPEPEIAVPAPVRSEMSLREKELFLSCIIGDVGRFRRFFRRGNFDVNKGGKDGPLLCMAAYLGYTGIVRELLSAPGIDVNLAKQSGFTPLLLASQNGHAEVVELLLEKKGINVNLVSLNGDTPLILAAHYNFPKIVEQLVRRGAHVNQAFSRSTTALYTAAYYGHVEVVRVLLQAPGIRVNHAANWRYIPFVAAAQQGHKDVVRLLLRKGADPNITTTDG